MQFKIRTILFVTTLLATMVWLGTALWDFHLRDDLPIGKLETPGVYVSLKKSRIDIPASWYNSPIYFLAQRLPPGRVTELYLQNPATDPLDLPTVANLTGLHTLTLQGVTKPRDIEALQRLPHLENLNLHGPNACDSFVDTLLKFESLKKVSFGELVLSEDSYKRMTSAGLTVRHSGLTYTSNFICEYQASKPVHCRKLKPGKSELIAVIRPDREQLEWFFSFLPDDDSDLPFPTPAFAHNGDLRAITELEFEIDYGGRLECGRSKYSSYDSLRIDFQRVGENKFDIKCTSKKGRYATLVGLRLTPQYGSIES